MKNIFTYEQFLKESRYSDEILDKILDKGIDSLSDAEKHYLDTYDDKKDKLYYKPKNSKEENKLIITSKLPVFKTHDLSFTLNNVENVDDRIVYNGVLNFNGQKFIGEIDCDMDGYYITHDFQDDKGIDLADITEGLEHDLDTFFTEEVIPIIVKK